ncbi:MAG: hypothetical protein NVSMB9_17880 [Isosphaeraceae bacterium]
MTDPDPRELIARIAGAFEARNPAYATALNQQALLLIMQGDPGSAEFLLHEALEVRRETLGERHPDYATNLSSLGGLLWERGDLDTAEPLLRKAAEVRVETLGPAHPKSVVSVRSLAQFLELKHDSTPRRPEPSPRDFSRVPVVKPCSTEPTTSSSSRINEPFRTHSLADFHEELTLEFQELGERLLGVSRRLRTEGTLPDVEVLVAYRKAVERFRALQNLVSHGSEELGVPLPAGGSPNLAAMAEFLPSLRAAEERRASVERKRSEALAVLERVDRIRCPGHPESSALLSCQEVTRDLRRALTAAPAGETCDEAERLVEGTHPLCALLTLVRSEETTSDAEWALCFDAVEAGLGQELAVAGARSRLKSNID